MKDKGQYIPSGELQGDTGALRNRSTGTGVVDAYGADLSGDATNRAGSIKGSSKSDPADACCSTTKIK